MNTKHVNILIAHPTPTHTGYMCRMNVPVQAIRDLAIPTTGFWMDWHCTRHNEIQHGLATQDADFLVGTLIQAFSILNPPTPTAMSIFRGGSDAYRYVNFSYWYVTCYNMQSTKDGGPEALFEWDTEEMRIIIDLRYLK